MTTQSGKNRRNLIAKTKRTAFSCGSYVLNLVGAARFELTASCTRNKRATKLRHAPTFVVAVHQQRM